MGASVSEENPDPDPDPSEPHTPFVNFVDPHMRRLCREDAHVAEFWLALALNQEVMPEEQRKPDGSVVIALSASNPDEAALVYGARHYGASFVKREPKHVTVEVHCKLGPV